jgi:hypothetical protein
MLCVQNTSCQAAALQNLSTAALSCDVSATCRCKVWRVWLLPASLCRFSAWNVGYCFAQALGLSVQCWALIILLQTSQ